MSARQYIPLSAHKHYNLRQAMLYIHLSTNIKLMITWPYISRYTSTLEVSWYVVWEHWGAQQSSNWPMHQVVLLIMCSTHDPTFVGLLQVVSPTLLPLSFPLVHHHSHTHFAHWPTTLLLLLHTTTFMHTPCSFSSSLLTAQCHVHVVGATFPTNVWWLLFHCAGLQPAQWKSMFEPIR